MDWLALLAVQGTLRSLLQHHSSTASVLWRPASFMVHLSSTHDHWSPPTPQFHSISSLAPSLLYGAPHVHSRPLVSSNTTVPQHQFFGAQPPLWSTSRPLTTIGRAIAWMRRAFVSSVSAFELAKLVIAFLPRSKRLLISWLQSPSTVIWSPRK